MNQYEKLEALLKVASENMRVLHRNLVGMGWKETHEQLEDEYHQLDDITDDIVETGISQGIKEIGMAEALENATLLAVEDRTVEQSLSAAKKMLTDIVEAMDGVMEQVDEGWIISKLEAYQEWMYKEADYKIAQQLRQR